MGCKQCGSERSAEVGGKVSDMCSASVEGGWRQDQGYVPDDMNVGGGDYIEISFCLDCGQMDGRWPAKTSMEDLSESPGTGCYRYDQDGAETEEPLDGRDEDG